MRRRVAATAAAVVVLGGALTACGSSDSGGGSASASAWNIGVAASCTGPLVENGGKNASQCDVYKAWANDVNKSGGVNGHKINLVVKDDASNPATSQTQVRELVEKDHVIAILGAVPSPQFGTYLQQKGVPYVAAGNTSAEFMKFPLFFNVSLNAIAMTYGEVSEAVKEGGTKLGYMYCAEDPACAAAVPLLTGAAQANGATMETAKIAATAPDYTAQCLKFKDAGVQAMQIGSVPQVALRILKDCDSQGLDVKLMAAAGSINESFLTDKNTEGIAAVSGVAPWFDTTIPGIKSMQDSLAKADIEVKDPGVTDAWASAKTLEASIQSLGDKPTSADVINGLYGLKGETSDGLTQPLTFLKDQPNLASSNCYFPFTIKGGEWNATSNGKPVCIDPQKIQPFFKALAG